MSVGGSPTGFFASVPAQLVPAFTAGFHQAFSIAVANSMWIGVLAAGLACLTSLALKEKPLRAHLHAEQSARMGLGPRPAGIDDQAAAATAYEGPARGPEGRPAALQ